MTSQLPEELDRDFEHGDLQSGQQFGQYEIVGLLGRGAFGAVYEVLRLPLKKRLALKILHPEFVRQREVVDRFVREAEIVAQLNHPHIVDVFDVGVHRGQPFIAMEFLDGEPLAARLTREGSLSVSAAVDLMLAVTSAVSAVHVRGVVHRDIKPDNIFLSQRPTGGVVPKLLDFGIAKTRDPSAALTRTNTMMGTPFYMSPEQVEESKSVAAASDQWALAVILFECVCGVKPFQGDTLIALLNAITAKPIPSPTTVNPALPVALERVILRGLEREPTERFPSVLALGAALLPFASPREAERWAPFFLATEADGSAGTGAVEPVDLARTLEPATGSPSTPASRKGRFMALAAAATLAVTGALLLWASRRAPPAPSVERRESVPLTAIRPPSARPLEPARTTVTDVPGATVLVPLNPSDPAPAQVSLQLSSPTDGAYAIVRGEQHDLPWQARLPRREVAETIEVRARHHRPAQYEITLDQDRTLTAVLRRGRESDEPAATPATSTSQATNRGEVTEPAAAPTPPPSEPPAPPRATPRSPIYQGPAGTIPAEI